MKRINILLSIVIATLFVACSSSSLEGKAKERVKNYIEKAIGGKTKSHSITDVESIFSDDSICILQFNVNGEDFSGEKETVKVEYYILWTVTENPKLLENVYVLDEDKRSVMDRVLNFEENLPDDKKKKSHALRAFIPGLDAFSAKEVEE